MTGQLYLQLVRGGIPLRFISGALKKLTEGSGLRRAFARTVISGLDADSPHAKQVRELIESYGWKWVLEERKL